MRLGHICAFIIFVLFAYTVFVYFSFNALALKRLPNLTSIYDKSGNLLQTYQDREEVSYQPITLQQVPTYCKEALVATEDKNFYSNIGLDLTGLVRGVTSLFNNTDTGGSTISQQVVKISHQDFFERSILDKVNEAIEAVRLNSSLSKDDILTIYANNVSLGNGIYGLGAGAEEYFDKDISQLNLSECAYLAGLPQRPAVFNPNADLIAGTDRQVVVLQSMLRDNYISQDQYAKAVSADLKFTNNSRTIKAPHFTKYVLDNEPTVATDDVILNTTYDYASHQQNTMKLQQTFTNSDINASLIILSNDGKILNMIGSTDYFSTKFDGSINKTTDLIQPAGTLAPFIAKATDLNSKLTILKQLQLIDDTSAARCDNQMASHNCETSLLNLVNTYRSVYAGKYSTPQFLVSTSVGGQILSATNSHSMDLPQIDLSQLEQLNGYDYSYISTTPSNNREVVLFAHNEQVTIGLWAGRNNNSTIDTPAVNTKLINLLKTIIY